MSQYSSRIYVKVNDINDWNKLSDVDFKQYGFYSNPFLNFHDSVFEINGDWSCFEDELTNIVREIATRIPNCIIFADTTNINVDPYDFVVYYLGDDVYNDEIDGDMFWETSLSEPFTWLAQADINITHKRIEYLKSFGFEE